MTNLLAYRCKFCGTLGTAECGEDCPELDKMAWLPLLCCDRCGAYQEWLRRILSRVAKWSREWSLRSQKDQKEKAAATRAMLEKFTKQIAAVMCRFHRVEFTWTDDFVNELLAHPQVSQTIVRSYESGLRWKARGGRSPQVYEETQ